jgi:hypothetical protein
MFYTTSAMKIVTLVKTELATSGLAGNGPVRTTIGDRNLTIYGINMLIQNKENLCSNTGFNIDKGWLNS